MIRRKNAFSSMVRKKVIEEVGIIKFQILLTDMNNNKVLIFSKELMTQEQANKLHKLCEFFQRQDATKIYDWHYDYSISKVMSEYFATKFKLDCLEVNKLNVHIIENKLKKEYERLLKWDKEIDSKLIVKGMKSYVLKNFKGHVPLLWRTDFFSSLKIFNAQFDH